MIENKKNLIQHYGEEFQDRYVMDAKDFAREMVLDVSQCENCLYILPQLTRESQCKKGLYRTDKIIVSNYSQCFKQKLSMEIVDMLQDASASLQDILSQEKVQRCFADLFSGDSDSWEVKDFNRNVIKYMLYQFKAIAQAHRYEIMRKST